MHMIEGRIHEFIINFYFIDDMCVLYILMIFLHLHTQHTGTAGTCSTSVVQGLVCVHTLICCGTDHHEVLNRARY